MTMKKATFVSLIGAISFCVGSCGSKKEEDLKKMQDEQAASKKAEKGESSRGVLVSSGQSSNAEPEKLPQCFFTLGQSIQFRGADVEAQFKGAVDMGCKADGKESVLLIQSGGIQLSLPVELDCQPKKRDQFNITCSNVASLIDASGKVDLRIKADANYKSSQVKIWLGFE